ncbi:hypothetical protein vseg_019662 [Gypsophila vaccaria]
MRQRQRQKFREEKYVQNLWQSCLVLMMWSSRKGQLGKLAKLQLKMECARGDTPSSARLFDAIVSGCIPVIVSDELELPFEGIIDYRKVWSSKLSFKKCHQNEVLTLSLSLVLVP